MSTEKWLAGQSDHAVACAVYGDCIYDEVQDGAKTLEGRWKKSTQKWDGLIDKAVKTGFMGWGSHLVDRKWLSWMLFHENQWPSELTQKERNLLRLMVATTGFNRLYSQGVKVDRSKGITTDPERAEAHEQTVTAMKKLAELYRREIAIPMWKQYHAVTATYGGKIQPLCDERYGESCSESDAKDIFKGDLRRGWKAKTLDVGPPMYRALPHFFAFIAG